MEIEVYKEKNRYYAKINEKIIGNRDSHCLGLGIVHNVADKYNGKSIDLKVVKKQGVSFSDVENIKKEIKNSALNNGKYIVKD